MPDLFREWLLDAIRKIPAAADDDDTPEFYVQAKAMVSELEEQMNSAIKMFEHEEMVRVEALETCDIVKSNLVKNVDQNTSCKRLS